MAPGLEYQHDLLADIIQDAQEEGLLTAEEAQNLERQLSKCESMDEVHDVWGRLEEEYHLLNSEIWDL